MDAILQSILPHLPPSLQGIILNPPSLSNPSSFVPLIRALLPYTQYAVVLLAFYIVYSTLTGLFGYFSRFVRFSLRIAPIIGIIGWLMKQSGQGGIDELWDVARDWAGVGDQNARARSPGIAGWFGDSKPKRGARSKTSWGDSDAFSGQSRSKRTAGRSKASDSGGEDFLASLLGSAAGKAAAAAGVNEADWSGIVQDYVKSAVAKAAGLDWLFGDAQDTKTNTRSKSKSRTR